MTISSQHDDPLYGRAGEVIDGETLQELLRRQNPIHDSARKRRAQRAYDAYTGDLAGHVLAAIGWQQSSKTIEEDMRHFVTEVRNDARDITEQLAVVYKNGAERHLANDGDDEDQRRTEQEDALRMLAIECAIDEVGEQVNHLAFLQGTQYVVPIVRRGVLCADVVGPHIYDTVQDIDDPYGMPIALAWRITPPSTTQVARPYEVFVLDSVSLRRFRVENGESVESGEPVIHNLGRLAAAQMRFRRPITGDDLHQVDQQRRLVTGTIDVLVLMARMGLVRKAQCHNLLTMVGDLSGVPKGQEKGDPETVLTADTKGKGERTVTFNVHDYNTPPDDFIKMILFWVLSMAEPYGGFIQVDAGQPDIYGKIVIPPAEQTEHRKRQIRHCMSFEREFWSAAKAMLDADGHRLAIDLPTATEVYKNLRVNFGEMSRDLEEPSKAILWNDWKLSRCLTTEVSLMQRQLGGVSSDEAWRELRRNTEDRAKFLEMIASRSVPTGEGGTVTSLAQLLGALGTPVREANRAGNTAQGEDPAAGGQSGDEPT